MVLPVLGSMGGAANAAWPSIVAGAAKVGGFLTKFGGPLLNAFGGQGGDKSNLSRHAIFRVVRDAKESGIHPLFALGSSANVAPQLAAGSSTGDALRATGQIFENLRSESEAKASAGMSDRLAMAQLRAINAQAARDETQAQLALSQFALDQQALAAQNRDRVNSAVEAALASHPGLFFPEVIPDAMVKVRLPSGKVIMIPDQSLMETGEAVGNVLTGQEQSRSLWDDFKTFWQEAKRNRAARARKRSSEWEPAGVIHKIQR